ncbi:tetratricopeptide repeat protein, partial [Candidatus Dependentiae bacterium]
NNPKTFYNAALALRRSGQYEEAIEAYETAIKLKPNYKDAYFGLGQTYLILGDFERGLPIFEKGRISDRQKSKSFLTDASQIPGSIVLIRPDWGLGDMIQFIRYAKLIKEHGGTVWLLPHKPLDTILRSCPYIDNIVDRESARGFNKQVSPMSLPYIFKTTIDTIPSFGPYLFANEDLIDYWKEKFQQNNFNIGICWEGSTTALYPRKDVPLEQFKEIANIPGVSLYSLQKINGTQQLEDLPFIVHQFGPDFDQSHGRFMDTAAVMKNLDLVLTVDTSVAHLAGALGVPAWVFLPYAPDWRWLTKRDDTPWYPTMKLFRQEALDDWTEALEKVKKELQKMVSKS